MPYATADFFRTGTATQFVPSGELTNCIVTQKGWPVLIWDGSNAGEVFVGRDAVLASTMALIRPDESVLEKGFCYFFLKTAFDELNEGTTGSTIPHVSKHMLMTLQIPIPPLTEQRLISGLLFRLESAIAIQSQLAAATSELKRAAMRALFTRGLRGEPQKDTEIGPVPESWSVAPFDRALKIAQGQVDPRTEPYASMLHIGPENVEPHTGHLLACQRAKDLGLISGKYLFARGDIVYSKIRPYLNKVAMPEFDGICSADMYPLRACEGFESRFLFHYLQSEYFLRQAVPHQLRTGIPKINREQLSDTAFPRPLVAEQKDISAIFDAIDRKIALHREKRRVLEELFKALLHKLMTGEIRVADLDLSALGTKDMAGNPKAEAAV